MLCEKKERHILMWAPTRVFPLSSTSQLFSRAPHLIYFPLFVFYIYNAFTLSPLLFFFLFLYNTPFSASSYVSIPFSRYMSSHLIIHHRQSSSSSFEQVNLMD